MEKLPPRFAFSGSARALPAIWLTAVWRKPPGDAAFDVIPITADGRFVTDPTPPGKYLADLFAISASSPPLSSQSSDFSGQLTFSIPEQGELPKVEIVAKANRPPDLSQVTDMRIRVVDEDGKPLAKP